MAVSSFAVLQPATLEDNWWQQVEEIVALHAIYSDDFTFRGSAEKSVVDIDTLQCTEPPSPPIELKCSISINVELPQQTLAVQALEHGSREYKAVTVKHLPPLKLKLTFLPAYPSTLSPIAEFSCCWLSYAELGKVRQKLAEQWTEHGPGPICHVWIEWLRSGLLPYLGVTNQKVVNSVAALEKFKHYASSVEQRSFSEGVWLCKICLEPFPGTHCIPLLCGHIFCTSCLQDQCKLHVKEGTVEQLKCPDPECAMPLHPQTLQAVLTPAELARWEELVLKRSLDGMSDMTYCPRCSTPCMEDNDHCVQCPKCFFVFCALCFGSWHPGDGCESLETKLKSLQVRSRTLQDEQLIRRTKEELESVKCIEDTAKRCPKCGMAIQKLEGCNKVVCTSCRTKFCFECGKEISGYEHYRSGMCVLFDEEQIRQWELDWEDEILRAQQEVLPGPLVHQAAEAEVWGDLWQPRLRHCGQCGQPNLKIGNNNHMACWACRSSFCYQCGELLPNKRVSQHFKRPGACRQHSWD